MRIRTVFNKLLALQGAWVRKVAFTKDGLEVDVEKRAARHRCPQCAFSTRARYDRREGRWRHIALGKWKVTVCSTVSRLHCPRHGVLVEAVPWAAAGSRFTLDFESLVGWCAREMTFSAVTRLLHLSWRAVHRIARALVGRKLDPARLDELYEIGLDEVSYRKRHKYLSVIADHRTGDPVWLDEGRSRDTVGKFFDELGPERTSKLKVVTMDMCAPYIAEVRARAPQAEIAFDPFHVVQLANEAVHQVRRDEARALKGLPAAAVLKNSRWTLLRATEDADLKDLGRLVEIQKLNGRVYRAYLLKEELRALYRCTPRSASTHLEWWLAWASRSKLRPFTRLAKTLRNYRDGVLASIRLAVSNGRLESINAKIDVLKRRAFGFHSAAALIAMVFLCCTKIQVELPT